MIINVGIIGLGMIGESMLSEFLNHPSFNVSLAWDLNEQINERISNRLPQVRIAKDAEEIIENSDINLVYIATPPVTHVDYGLKVIQASKALLCEKPLAIDLEAARRLVEKAEETGTPTAMNFVYGAGGIVETIENQLNAGVFGTPQSIEIRYQFPSWPLPNQVSAANWITKRHEGGMIREMFSHFVYLVHRLFGQLEVNSTFLQYPEGDNTTESFVLASLQTGDMPVWLMGGVGGVAAPRESELTIHGTDASLRLGGLYNVSITNNGSWRELPIERETISVVHARLSALALLLQGKPTTLPDLRAGLQVQEVIEKMLDH